MSERAGWEKDATVESALYLDQGTKGQRARDRSPNESFGERELKVLISGGGGKRQQRRNEVLPKGCAAVTKSRKSPPKLEARWRGGKPGGRM